MEDTNLLGRAQRCPDCRALVSDLEAHEHWHSRLVADIAAAVYKEIRKSTALTG